MICTECRQPIPDAMLVCPACAHKRSASAMRAVQHDALRQVAAGRGELMLRAINGKRHVKQFGAEVTFCGIETNAANRKTMIPWDGEERLDNVCERCQGEIKATLEPIGDKEAL